MDTGNDSDKPVCSGLGQREPQGGVLSTAWGQKGQRVPWEEGERRPDKNSEDEMTRQLSCGKAPSARGIAHAKEQIWQAPGDIF